MTKPKFTCPEDAKKSARCDKRIVEIFFYPDGWVPGAYNWPAPGRRVVFARNKSRQWVQSYIEPIDRKRPHGEGPAWVGMSENLGRLASG